jgi:glycosyltransferase involved in cell wall biosynthesis
MRPRAGPVKGVILCEAMRVAVVIPAYNEELTIARTVESLPSLVEHALVIDDASTDRTAAEALRRPRRGLELLRHARNRGVGAAISTGYQRALALGADYAVVMAGDGQMDPRDLPVLLEPLAAGRADYVKGNRFRRREVWAEMPYARLAGNVALSLATRITSGYWHLFDSQCGYTAASRRALEVIAASGLFPRYGYPNDLLARLHSASLRVEDVPVRTIYGPTWRSGIGLHTVVYPMSFVLVRSWIRRLLDERVARRAAARTPGFAGPQQQGHERDSRHERDGRHERDSRHEREGKHEREDVGRCASAS